MTTFCYFSAFGLLLILLLWLICMLKANPRETLTECKYCHCYRDEYGNKYLLKPEGFDDLIKRGLCPECQADHDAWISAQGKYNAAKPHTNNFGDKLESK